MARTAKITREGPGNWDNVHRTVRQDYDRLVIVDPPFPPNGSTILDDMKATTDSLKVVLGEARDAGQRLRGLGGGWSLSAAAITDGWLLSTRRLNLFHTMGSLSVHQSYKDRNGGDISRLRLVQCGMSIHELNGKLERRGMALTTSGASNGQTIAGALSTGTHGSAFKFGAMPEFVVAMHFVVGPGRDIWLERASSRVVSDAFIDRMGTELIRNDVLFNAALVSFGSFGILHAVLIEAEPVYLLEAQRYRAPIDSRLRRTMRTLDFTDFDLPHDPEDLWHFELVFNPHDLDSGPYVRTMYKREFVPGHPKPQMPGGVLGPGDGLLAIIGDLTESIPGTFFPSVVNHFVDQQLPIYGPVFGTHSEIFTLTTTRGRGMSMEFAVALEDTERVLELLTAAKPEINIFAGVMALRYVKKSTATLGFTKFDVSCTFEFNAASNSRTLAFYDRVWNDLEAEGIPYTLHWGQQNNFTPERIVNMYGAAAVNEWKRARVTLLNPDMQEVFNSPFLEQCGLDDAGEPFIPV